MMRKLNPIEIENLRTEKRFFVLHIDAAWDGYRDTIETKIQNIEAANNSDVTFGYLDCDEHQDFASRIGVLNVPSVAYFEGNELRGLIIGKQQDVSENIELMRSGKPLDSTNRNSRN